MLSRGDRIETDGADHAGVGELRLGRDDTVGDEVVDGLPLISIDVTQRKTSNHIHYAPLA